MTDTSHKPLGGHTPGPWRSHGAGGEIHGNSRVVATMTWCSGMGAEDEANARLIATAPDMALEIERLRAALHQIDSWSRAYPLKVFPEPDFKKAAELLRAGGITLDAVSASNMRHVVEGVGKIARDAIEHQSFVASRSGR